MITISEHKTTQTIDGKQCHVTTKDVEILENGFVSVQTLTRCTKCCDFVPSDEILRGVVCGDC